MGSVLSIPPSRSCWWPATPTAPETGSWWPGTRTPWPTSTVNRGCRWIRGVQRAQPRRRRRRLPGPGPDVPGRPLRRSVGTDRLRAATAGQLPGSHQVGRSPVSRQRRRSRRGAVVHPCRVPVLSRSGTSTRCMPSRWSRRPSLVGSRPSWWWSAGPSSACCSWSSLTSSTSHLYLGRPRDRRWREHRPARRMLGSGPARIGGPPPTPGCSGAALIPTSVRARLA